MFGLFQLSLSVDSPKKSTTAFLAPQPRISSWDVVIIHTPDMHQRGIIQGDRHRLAPLPPTTSPGVAVRTAYVPVLQGGGLPGPCAFRLVLDVKRQGGVVAGIGRVQVVWTIDNLQRLALHVLVLPVAGGNECAERPRLGVRTRRAVTVSLTLMGVYVGAYLSLRDHLPPFGGSKVEKPPIHIAARRALASHRAFALRLDHSIARRQVAGRRVGSQAGTDLLTQVGIGLDNG